MTVPFIVGRRPKPLEGWQAVRLKDVCYYVNRGVAPEYAEVDTGVVAFSQKCVLSEGRVDANLGRPIVDLGEGFGSARLGPGDIVINSTGTGTLGRTGIMEPVAKEDAPVPIADGHVTIIRTNDEQVLPTFLSFLLGTDAFRSVANESLAVGSTNQMELGRDAIRTLGFNVPTLSEQARIVAYLEAATERIDDLVTENRVQQLLLREMYMAELVYQLIVEVESTRYRVTRLKYLFESEFPGVWGSEPDGGEDDVLCVRVADFDRLNFVAGRSAETYRAVPESDRTRRLLHAGDVLLEKSGGTPDKPVGCAVSFDGELPSVCSNFIAVLRPLEGLDTRYCALLMAAHYQAKMNSPFVKQTTGIQNLDSHDYLGQRAGVPDLARQREVVNQVERLRDLVNRGLSEVQHQIELLLEHRQALITAAVTGDLDCTRSAA